MSDYTDIQPELDDFENAVYGEEVRDSMVSAIKKIYDIAESAAGAPDASTATAGQAPVADGQGGWAWGDVATSGDSVPTTVRQAILALFQNAAYISDDMSDEVAVVASWASEVTSIFVSPATLSINGMNQQTIVATTQPAGGIVTWSSSDESIATVSGGVVTPTGVNGSCTITAICGGKSATCAVTVSGFATLLSIDAVYTQSGIVYDTDTLDSLKSDLVVTGTYDDSRTLPITDYVLSGTLTVGISVITVSYGGKTTTFTVTVTDHAAINITYTQGSIGAGNTDSNRVSAVITSAVHFDDNETLEITVPSGYSVFPFGFDANSDSAIAGTKSSINNQNNVLYVYAKSDSGFVATQNSDVSGTLNANSTNIAYRTGYTPGGGWQTTKVTYAYTMQTQYGWSFTGLGFMVKDNNNANITPSMVESLITVTKVEA